MKSLKKNQLLALKAEMPMLDNKELLSIIGGDRYYFDSDGSIFSYELCSGTYVNVYGQELELSGTIGFEYWQHPSGISSGQCIYVTGQGVSQELLSFLVSNTNVEWLLVFNSGFGGGTLVTSNKEHSVKLNPDKEIEGDMMIHNHNQEQPAGWKQSGLSDGDWLTYITSPSDNDVKALRDSGKSKGAILYKGEYYEFYPDTYMTQDHLEELWKLKCKYKNN